jgi:hypothetical protein
MVASFVGKSGRGVEKESTPESRIPIFGFQGLTRSQAEWAFEEANVREVLI